MRGRCAVSLVVASNNTRVDGAKLHLVLFDATTNETAHLPLVIWIPLDLDINLLTPTSRVTAECFQDRRLFERPPIMNCPRLRSSRHLWLRLHNPV